MTGTVFSKMISPMTFGQFTAQIFEKECAVFPHEVDSIAQRFAFSFADLDRLISTYPFRSSDVRVVRNGEHVPASAYSLVQSSGAAIQSEAFVSLKKLIAHYQKGATLVIDRAHRLSDKLGYLCDAIEKETSLRAQANIYITPKGSQGFPVHFDTHDVFVIQIKGQKTWRLYESPVRLPTSYSSLKTSELQNEICLKEGDALYIPRGFQHEARTSSEASAHVTIGLHSVTWQRILQEFISWSSEQNDFMRESVNSLGAERAAEELPKVLEKLMEHYSAPTFAKRAKSTVASDFRNFKPEGILTQVF